MTNLACRNFDACQLTFIIFGGQYDQILKH